MTWAQKLSDHLGTGTVMETASGWCLMLDEGACGDLLMELTGEHPDKVTVEPRDPDYTAEWAEADADVNEPLARRLTRRSIQRMLEGATSAAEQRERAQTDTGLAAIDRAVEIIERHPHAAHSTHIPLSELES